MNATIKKIIKTVVRLILRPPVLLYRYVKDKFIKREKNNNHFQYLEFFCSLNNSIASICKKIMKLSAKQIEDIKHGLLVALRIKQENKELQSLTSNLEKAQEKHILKIQQLQEENSKLNEQLKKTQDELVALSRTIEDMQKKAKTEIEQPKQHEQLIVHENENSTNCIEDANERMKDATGVLYAAPSADGSELINATKNFNPYNSVYEISPDGTFSVCDNDEVIKKAIKNRDYLLKPCVIVSSCLNPSHISIINKGVSEKQEKDKWRIIQKVQIKLD